MVRFNLDKLDYIYFATYALILSGIVISVVELIANLRSKDILAKRLELFGRVFQPFFSFCRNWNFYLPVCLDRQREGPINHNDVEE
jgi:hypothetical protein